MKKVRGDIISVFLLLFTWVHVCSQDYILDFRTYSTEDGLAGNLGLQFLEDDKGFVWILTQDGISRFDGKSFKNFFTDKNTYGSDFNLGLHEDIHGNIWTPYFQKKPEHPAHQYLIDSNFQIKPVDKVYGEKMPFRSEDIFHITNFGTDTLYLVLKSGRIFRFDGNFVELPSHPKCANLLLLKIESDGTTHLSSNEKILTINNRGELTEEAPRWIGNNLSVEKFEAQILDFLYVYPDTKGYESLFLSLKDDLTGINQQRLILHRVRFNNNIYYTAKSRTLLSLYDENFNLIYNFSKNLREEFGSIYVSGKMLLRKNQIWFINNNGFCVIDWQPNPFRHYQKDPGTNSVRGIYVNSKNRLFANMSGGFWEMDMNSGNLIHDIPKSNHTTWGILETEDEFYLGSYGSRFYGYNKKEKRYRKIHLKKNQIPEKKGDFSTPFRDKTGQIYVGTRFGLLRYDESSDSLELFDKYNEFESLKTKRVHSFFEDKEGIWLSTSNGLYVFDYEKGITEYHEPSPELSIMHFYRDDSVFWLATYGQGLVKWNKTTGITTHFGRDEGFLNEKLTGIYPDENDNLWIATETGLVRFNTETEDIRVFLESDGITHNEFNKGSHFQAKDGTIYFGGLNGITAFHPDSLSQKTKSIYPFRITNYYELNRETGVFEERTGELLHSRKIHLTPQVKSFRIHFSLLNYKHSDKTQYAYKIEDYDQNWNYQNENFIRLNELPYGNYTLKIKAQSYEGHWMPEIISVPISVEIPFYEKPIWQILGLLFLSFFIYLRYKWSQYKSRQREILLERTVAERTKTINKQKLELESLNKTKDRLFSVIGHDLRDPVISFMGLSKKINFLLGKNDTKRVADLGAFIEKEAQYLHDLLNNLLNWTLTQRNELKVVKTSVSVFEIVEKLRLSNQHLSELTEVEFLNEVPKSLNVTSDRPILETVFRNLISNAFRHTKRGNFIRIRTEAEGELVMIFIEDNGVGMSEEQLRNLFEIQKNTSNDKNFSFGLHLCRELINLLGGRISVINREGKGTTFMITLPKGI